MISMIFRPSPSAYSLLLDLEFDPSQLTCVVYNVRKYWNLDRKTVGDLGRANEVSAGTCMENFLHVRMRSTQGLLEYPESCELIAVVLVEQRDLLFLRHIGFDCRKNNMGSTHLTSLSVIRAYRRDLSYCHFLVICFLSLCWSGSAYTVWLRQ